MPFSNKEVDTYLVLRKGNKADVLVSSKITQAVKEQVLVNMFKANTKMTRSGSASDIKGVNRVFRHMLVLFV